MAIPECKPIPRLPAPRQIVFPGGAALSQVLAAGSEIPSGLDAATNLLAQASPAMAPLMPIFNIIDAVLALVECVQAVPDALGPPPDPAKMAEALSGLTEKLPKLLDLLPQVATPRMVIGMVDTLIDFLKGLRDQIEAILLQAERTRAARAKADLLHIAGCAEAQGQAQLQAMADALAPMNTLTSALSLRYACSSDYSAFPRYLRSTASSTSPIQTRASPRSTPSSTRCRASAMPYTAVAGFTHPCMYWKISKFRLAFTGPRSVTVRNASHPGTTGGAGRTWKRPSL